MEAMAWFIITALLVLLLCLIILRLRSSQSIHLPPGPLYLPIITDIFLLQISFSKLKPIIRKLHAKHGPIITFHFWSTPHIFISDRLLAHQALIQNAVVFADRPKFLKNHQFNIASSCYGPTWHAIRNNLASIMLQPSRFKSFSKARKCVLDALISKLKFEANFLNNSVELINYIRHAIFCLLFSMCFGENVDSRKIEKIKDIQRRLILSSGQLGALNFFPKIVSRVLFRKRWQEFTQLRKLQNDLLVELIQARKKVIEKNNDDDEYVVCYVDTLLNLRLPEEKRKLNEGEVVALCSEFLTAGTDTTSTTLEWVMANLVKDKHVQQMLVEEIEEVVGEREEREVREEDLEKLPYLKAVILEGLRRHPPTHYTIPRVVTEDIVLNGYLVPKNGTVNFMVADIGLDPTVWEDPTVFKPERFLKDAKNRNEFDAFDVRGIKEIKMMPFGAGRRICPAYKLAMLHLEYFVANLVLNFEWKTSLPGSNVDLTEKQEFTMVMKYPLEAQISLRN
ncbi:putative cytochrome P450 [Medicago truncatula]|uniref:Cytochrome P450 family protein n=2 Tax=Medicago truncatula TaxID=3880 RepID=G7LFG5_MEDTR|nr:cytochrome P450 family protein [Medicago truncatula]RHN41300.1 putative cytochrome P450 [Medicago truncatula]